MKKLMLLACVLAGLVLPSVASAHTGTVTCDSTGVVFSYRANFERATVVVETVNGVSKPFTVPKWHAVTNTWPGVTGTIVATSKWKGGGIKAVTLVCPTPAPPVTPVQPAPPAPAPPAAVPVTTSTPSNVQAVTTTPSVVKPPTSPPATHTSAAKCPKGTLDLGMHGKVKMCLRVVRVPAKKKTPGHHATKPASKFHDAGVTG